ncbi:hypothetical protein DRO61_03340 [Candidatus Bathyarchaeota archaeon]|jgi:hypothetical protein|nr:MAG: hypothetical protein DRO61_03340 [Candidatus Bathyarchaeota archaeon]
MEKKIKIIILSGFAYLAGVYSAMYFCYKQPTDEHVQIINRELNFPKQDCYSESDIELIIYGE